MNRTTLLVLTGVILALTACGGDAGPPRDPSQPVLLGFDPVALVEGERVAGSKELSVTRETYLYLFANAENKAKFEADPEAYGIQGDGSCVVSPEARASVDIFTVHEEKIYTFASAECLDHFKADPELYLN